MFKKKRTKKKGNKFDNHNSNNNEKEKDDNDDDDDTVSLDLSSDGTLDPTSDEEGIFKDEERSHRYRVMQRIKEFYKSFPDESLKPFVDEFAKREKEKQRERKDNSGRGGNEKEKENSGGNREMEVQCMNKGKARASFAPAIIDPSITFASIGGADDIIETVMELVFFPQLHYSTFRRFNIEMPHGIIFYGPPGTGKTMMAKAICNACNALCSSNNPNGRRISFYNISLPDIQSKYYGESEKILTNLFLTARNNAPSIIFIDEIDGLISQRSSGGDNTGANNDGLISTLLSLMDGLSTNDIQNQKHQKTEREKLIPCDNIFNTLAQNHTSTNINGNKDGNGELMSSTVFVIGCTNRLESIDSAFRRPGRFDKEIEFRLPDAEARRQIILLYLKKYNVLVENEKYLEKMKNVQNNDSVFQDVLELNHLDMLVELTDGFSPSEIMNVVRQGVISALRRDIDNPVLLLSDLSLDNIISGKNSISPSGFYGGLFTENMQMLKSSSIIMDKLRITTKNDSNDVIDISENDLEFLKNLFVDEFVGQIDSAVVYDISLSSIENGEIIKSSRVYRNKLLHCNMLGNSASAIDGASNRSVMRREKQLKELNDEIFELSKITGRSLNSQHNRDRVYPELSSTENDDSLLTSYAQGREESRVEVKNFQKTGSEDEIKTYITGDYVTKLLSSAFSHVSKEGKGIIILRGGIDSIFMNDERWTGTNPGGIIHFSLFEQIMKEYEISSSNILVIDLNKFCEDRYSEKTYDQITLDPRKLLECYKNYLLNYYNNFVSSNLKELLEFFKKGLKKPFSQKDLFGISETDAGKNVTQTNEEGKNKYEIREIPFSGDLEDSFLRPCETYMDPKDFVRTLLKLSIALRDSMLSVLRKRQYAPLVFSPSRKEWKKEFKRGHKKYNENFVSNSDMDSSTPSVSSHEISQERKKVETIINKNGNNRYTSIKLQEIEDLDKDGITKESSDGRTQSSKENCPNINENKNLHEEMDTEYQTDSDEEVNRDKMLFSPSDELKRIIRKIDRFEFIHPAEFHEELMELANKAKYYNFKKNSRKKGYYSKGISPIVLSSLLRQMADEIRLRDEDIHPRILAACELIRAQRRRMDREAKLRSIFGRSRAERIEEAKMFDNLDLEKNMLEQSNTSTGINENDIIDNERNLINESEEMRTEKRDTKDKDNPLKEREDSMMDNVYSIYLSFMRTISDNVNTLVMSVLGEGNIAISSVTERINVRLARKLRLINNKCLKNHSCSHSEQLDTFKNMMKNAFKSLISELYGDM